MFDYLDLYYCRFHSAAKAVPFTIMALWLGMLFMVSLSKETTTHFFFFLILRGNELVAKRKQNCAYHIDYRYCSERFLLRQLVHHRKCARNVGEYGMYRIFLLAKVIADHGIF